MLLDRPYPPIPNGSRRRITSIGRKGAWRAMISAWNRLHPRLRETTAGITPDELDASLKALRLAQPSPEMSDKDMVSEAEIDAAISRLIKERLGVQCRLVYEHLPGGQSHYQLVHLQQWVHSFGPAGHEFSNYQFEALSSVGYNDQPPNSHGTTLTPNNSNVFEGFDQHTFESQDPRATPAFQATLTIRAGRPGSGARFDYQGGHIQEQ